MTDDKKHSSPVKDSHKEHKTPKKAKAFSFWHDKKLAFAAAWAVFAVSFVAIAFPVKQAPKQDAPAAVADARETSSTVGEAQAEPFDITLGTVPEEEPLVPAKAAKEKGQKALDKKLPKEQKTVEKKPLEQKEPEQKVSVEAASEQKALVQKAVEKKQPEQKASLKKAVVQKALVKKAVAAKAKKDIKEAPTVIKASLTTTKVKPEAEAKKSAEAKTAKVEAEDREEQAAHQADLAQDYMKNGDVKQAMVHQHRAVELDPNNMLHRLNLGIMHDKVADKEGAATLYRQVIDAQGKQDKSLPSKVNIDDVRKRLDYISDGE